MESWKEELYHYGIEGQRWGIRRFQNEDGSLTPEGAERYSKKGLNRRYWNEDGTLTPSGRERHDKAVLREQERQAKATLRKQRRAIDKERKETYRNRRLMSESELSTAIKRLELEKKYTDLRREDVHPGSSYVNSLLKNSGKVIVPLMAKDIYGDANLLAKQAIGSIDFLTLSEIRTLLDEIKIGQ